MITDARALPDRSALETDVCVIGAGPAGITLARELTGLPFRVCVVESGGLEPDDDVQSLARIWPDVSSDLTPGLETRCRQFGGAANLWDVRATASAHGVRYLPLSPIDFEARSWVPHSGWPFTRSDLDPFYERAQRTCGLGPYTYRVADWERPGAERLPLDDASVETSIEQYGEAAVFTREYRQVLARASNVNVLLHASVTSLHELPSSPAIGRASVDCLTGKRHEVRASVFVLACGALENARLLLLSTGRSGAGVGNQHDLVGRFFMEHHNVRGGELHVGDPSLFARAALYDLRRVDGTSIMAKLTPSEALMRGARVLNAAARIEPRPPEHARAAARSVRTVVSSLRAGRVPASPGLHARALAHGLPHLLAFEWPARWSPARRGRYGWSALGMAGRRFASFGVELQIELAPDPENRVVLADARDRFGRPLPSVRWKWTALDRSSVAQVQRALAGAFQTAGIGTMTVASPDAGPEMLMPGGIHHHMGTTRLHADPKQGVADPDGRVHGVDNLFVTGSSVFPTGGYANPTLTIVALAIRLADHIRSLMRA